MNTAGRILSIYDKLTEPNRPQEKTMVWVWADVFDLPQDGPHLEDDVVTCLQAMRAEMDLLRTKLHARGAPEILLHPTLPRLRNATSPIYLNSQWKAIREETTTPENRIVLLWADWALRDEDEDDLPADEFSALLSELESLEKNLNSTAMTAYMRGFIQRQIDSIRIALRLYPIRGTKPIEEAARQVVGTCQLEASVLGKEFEKASEPTKGVLSRVGSFIEKTAKVADNLDKIRKSGEGGYALVTSVAPALMNLGQNVLRNLGN